jgi:teichuronic acid biosynthesis glycosyltransferase TuaG
MTNTVPVTVVVPCYNAAATLHRTMASILEQTVRPVSLILVDDASTDNTGEVLREIELRHPELVQRVTLAVNKGPSFARNVGWDAATTEFVAFLDADDQWHPQKLEILLGWFSKNPQAVFCSHQCIRYPGSPVEINSEQFLVRSFKFRDILISNRFSTPAVILRTAVGHRFPVSRRYAEDYRLWLMIAAEVGHLERIELPLAWYFKEPYGESGLSANLWAMEKGELAVLREMREKGHLSGSAWAALTFFSLAKFGRRCWHVI